MAQLANLSQDEFGQLIDPHQRELQIHCYRMMGSIRDAEDMVQETFLRAWRKRDTFEGRGTFRSWLYRIATNLCLDTLKMKKRRVVPMTHRDVSLAAEAIPPPVFEPIWLEPYPDELMVADDYTPESYITERENISLAFITALHVLPPRQRAILILRDVLELRTREVAELLEISESATKSALHRARSTLAEQTDKFDTGAAPDTFSQQQLDDYVQAWQSADIDTLLTLLKDDATFSMPPIPSWYRGHDEIRALTDKTLFSGEADGRWRLVQTHANRQLAFGFYRLNEDDNRHHAYGVQVVTLDGNLIQDITTIRVAELITYFDLPEIL